MTSSPEQIAEQACNECRRRKSKCDRCLPSCSLCIRFRRVCVFERSAKTPLTRRHLTEVETELARTKIQLQRLQQSTRSGQTGNYHDDDTLTVPSDIQDSEIQTALPTPQSRLHGDATQMPIQFQSVPESSRPIMMPSRDVLPINQTTSHQPLMTTDGLEERLPPSGDFDWDERNSKAAGQRLPDGMASLSGGARGYLGVASGAALLRWTEPHHSDDDARHPESTGISEIPSMIWSLGQLEPFIGNDPFFRLLYGFQVSSDLIEYAYFRVYHVSYPIVHEATFRAQFMEIIPRPKSSTWQVLLYTVAAIGAFTSASEPTEVDLSLFSKAKSHLNIDMLETGNLTLLQALTLISNYVQKRDKPNSGYNYTGLARRIAMGIGLHKEFSSCERTPLSCEQRRRAWWSLFVFDVGAIITFSRPLDFPLDGVEAKLPLNAHDSDITAATRTLPDSVEETTVYTHLRAQAQFHLVTCRIYPLIITTPLPSAAEMIRLDDNLIGTWLVSIPAYFGETTMQSPRFKLCHAILRCRYRNFRLLMYRPFLLGRMMSRNNTAGGPDTIGLGSSETEEAIQRCFSSAKESIDIIQHTWAENAPSMMSSWYCLYFLFQAVLIPIICIRNQPQSAASRDWQVQIKKAIEIMHSMRTMSRSAERCLKTIDNLCGDYLMTDTWDPTEESPQTQLTGLYPMMWPMLSDTAVAFDPMLQESNIAEFMSQMDGFE